MADEREMEQGSAAMALFDDETAEEQVRHVMHEGRLFFSVVDIIAALTGSANPAQYWRDMKRRIQDEGFIELLSAPNRTLHWTQPARVSLRPTFRLPCGCS